MRELSVEELDRVAGGCRSGVYGEELHVCGILDPDSGLGGGGGGSDSDDRPDIYHFYDPGDGGGGGGGDPPPCQDANGHPLSQLTTEQFSGPSPSLDQLNALVARAIEIGNTTELAGPAAAVAGAVVAGFFGAAVGAMAGRDLTQLYLFAEEYNLDPLISRVPGLDLLASGDGLIPGARFDTKYYDNQGPRVVDQGEDVRAFEPIGNFLYGYLGKLAGLSDAEIHGSAALAAGGQDEDRDTNNINAGINYFRQNGDRGFTGDQVGARQC